MSVKPITAKCPTCGTPVTWEKKSLWRPFCSDRCKLIDLGDWLEENHRIPDNGKPDTDDASY
jgi:uncharacterized protein